MKICIIVSLSLLVSPLHSQEPSPETQGIQTPLTNSAPKKKHKPIRPPKRPMPFSIPNAEDATPPTGSFAQVPSFEDGFDPGWDESHQETWRIASWKQNQTLMSPQRCCTNGQGLLEQTVLPELPGKGGACETTREFGYGRWVARVKPSSVSGVLNSIFTKDWDDRKTEQPTNDGGHSEVDIEFLSHTFRQSSGEVHLAIHLKGINPYWEEDVPLDFNPSDGFHDWGFDILPDRVVWHVDGKKLGEWIYDETHKIDPDYEFFFNSWTKGPPWINGPPKEKAVYQIDWVKFYPYQP